MRTLADNGDKRAARVLHVTGNPGKMLSAILIGNNIVNLSASSISTSLAIHLFGNTGAGIATGILTFLILIFGEVTPKTMATIKADSMSLTVAAPIGLLMKILTPVIFIINKLSLGLMFLLHVNIKDAQKKMTQEQFYQKLKEGGEIKTSMPLVGDVTDKWDELLKEYDEIVYIPMSSGLSSSCETAYMLSQDYDGKVQVVNNQRISVTMRQSVLDAKMLAEQGKGAEEIKEILEKEKFESSIYIMVDTLEYLKKGGRITPAAAALGTLLKLKPVLQIQGEKLDAFAKARTVKQAKTIMTEAMKNDFEKRFHSPNGEKMNLELAYTFDTAAAEAFKEEVQAVFPDNEIVMQPLSLSIACHIGPGALAIACSKKIEA